VTGQARWEGGGTQQFQIVLDGCADGGILNFHRHLFAGARDRAMNLAQRSGREWLLLELSKHFRRIFAEGRFELSARQGRVHPGRMHLQIGEFGDGFLRQSLRLQAQQLTQLHGRAFERAKFLARAA
jgi:hypothetical protein